MPERWQHKQHAIRVHSPSHEKIVGFASCPSFSLLQLPASCFSPRAGAKDSQLRKH